MIGISNDFYFTFHYISLPSHPPETPLTQSVYCLTVRSASRNLQFKNTALETLWAYER